MIKSRIVLNQKKIYWQLINSLGQSEKVMGEVVDARTKTGTKVLQTEMIIKEDRSPMERIWPVIVLQVFVFIEDQEH